MSEFEKNYENNHCYYGNNDGVGDGDGNVNGVGWLVLVLVLMG